ncbi:autotransporter outer membrane beta-barrel domain-containing protein [Escherichia coli]|nr:autotransporter outer membrane beta-barrel domain-containing protein [Escherichia coli]EIG1811016.1 autotransporter outer membrane beta-barrel domain-containing protein [Escherichia coli]EIH3304723.1 autotransporter outer membrane beta-barrel domain-containing protein [Escherichia coli]EIH8810197.1 autotransporter outer membrane beta-barrel domain-containing protein [Escherichia coli]EIQ3219299.1 autotransporter outer membrane beta-barrel domain-containing protein [Escherichia coli]
MNRIYRVIWNCTLQVFQACSELTRRAGKTSTVNLRKSSGLTTKFSRLTLGVLLALSGSASGASLEVDNDQITNIDTDVAYDAYLVGWYGTGVLNILAGGNASLTTITTSVIGANEDSEGTVNVLGGTWRLYDSGNNARPLNVGQSGTGTLNIKQKGHVDGGYLRLGSSTGGVGTVNVEGEDSVLTTELFEIGSYGTGSLNITDKGYVTSSIVAILGYQAGSNGQVVVEKGGEWLIKNNDSSIEFQIGNQGTGEATIREGGLITAENTIIGGNATGVGTLNVQDQDSVITVRRLYNGYFGNGTLNISNNGLINNKEYSLVGVQDGSHGVVNVTDKGHWNFLGTGEAFRYIYIGDAGDGELNVSREGKVDSGIITAGMKETGTGNITVKDKNSVITNLGTNLGYDGHGEMNISNEGLVVSNGGSSLGYGETGVGNVSITTGGMWEVNKNVYTTIGVAGVGNLNISDGGKFVSQNITFLGDKASGIGTLNLMDATSSFDTVGINVGNFGSGIVNVSNGATLNSTGYGFIGGNASGKGIVNISTDSLWNLKTSSTNAQLLGGDLAQWSSNAQDRWHLGVMAGYANQHSNTQSNRVGYKSDGRISGYSAGLYATWYQNDANKTGAYVDSWALYNWFDNSVSSDNRSADDYDSRGVTASVEGGYTFEAGTFSGSEETLNTWYVQPQAQITWMGVKDSDHTRKDGTRIETEGDGNVQTRLGVKTYLNSHHQRDDGKQREFQPYIEANWINNSKVYAVKMNGQTVGREGARNLGEVRTGVEAKVNNNLSLWGNVGVQLGDKGYSDTQGMLGVKYSW